MLTRRILEVLWTSVAQRIRYDHTCSQHPNLCQGLLRNMLVVELSSYRRRHEISHENYRSPIVGHVIPKLQNSQYGLIVDHNSLEDQYCWHRIKYTNDEYEYADSRPRC
jgi:hypothetical protein